jgi:hypothetical protein
MVNSLLNNILQDISSSVSNECSNISNNVQTIRFGNITSDNCNIDVNGISNDITSSITTKCLQSTNFKDFMKNKINEKIDMIRLSGFSDVSDSIKNTIEEHVDINQLSNCMSLSLNNQSISFGDIDIKNCPLDGKFNISNLENNMVSNIISECIQKDSPELEDIFNRTIPSPDKIIESIKNPPKKILDKNVIIGISVGSVILFLILCILVYYFIIKKNTNNPQ